MALTRLYLDEDLPPKVARLARAQGLDVMSSHECSRNSLPDHEQLRLAASEGRCFVTRNARDCLPLTRRFLENQAPHVGLLIVTRSLPNEDLAGIARALVAYVHSRQGELPSNFVDYLSRA